MYKRGSGPQEGAEREWVIEASAVLERRGPRMGHVRRVGNRRKDNPEQAPFYHTE